MLNTSCPASGRQAGTTFPRWQTYGLHPTHPEKRLAQDLTLEFERVPSDAYVDAPLGRFFTAVGRIAKASSGGEVRRAPLIMAAVAVADAEWKAAAAIAGSPDGLDGLWFGESG